MVLDGGKGMSDTDEKTMEGKEVNPHKNDTFSSTDIYLDVLMLL